GGEPSDVSDRLRGALESRRTRYAAGDLLRMLSTLTELEPRFRRSGQQRLLLEMLLVRFALLDRAVDLEAVLRGLGGAGRLDVGERPAGARAAPPREAPAAPGRREPSAAALPDLHRLTERWATVADALRAAGQALLASQLGTALPVAISGAGAVMIQPENDIAQQALERKVDDVLRAVRVVFPAVTRVTVRAAAGGAPPAERVTAESVREERVATLRRRDPALGAAIDALDLELLE
ncbi:MAG TPA: hypothetical protein VFY16_04470, partial [Gemmatimonadaceae bacterium]|nr:hypothetical protein [Gemmatimonadaceae bacterium]